MLVGGCAIIRLNDYSEKVYFRKFPFPSPVVITVAVFVSIKKKAQSDTPVILSAAVQSA